jgi:hypothetical protein
MVRLSAVALVVALGVSSVGAADEPWEIKTDGGYLSGARVLSGAANAQQFRKEPRPGVQRFLAYDKEGKSSLVGKGDADQWEFVSRGPGEFFIRATEGRWAGWYLATSDRAVKQGLSRGYLLELREKPQTFYVYQVGK